MFAGYYQFDVKFGRVEENLAKVADALGTIHADLIVLPELFATGYLFTSRGELMDFAEEYPGGKTISTLAEIARSRGMTVVAGFPERWGEKVYNSAAVVTPGGPAACYRKVHLYNEEKLYFDPGDAPFPVVDIGETRVGVMICFDWIFPESARTLALRGAQIICHPANIVMPYCPDAMTTRALENRVFAITCDRVGEDVRGEERLAFVGQSQIVSPAGKIIHRGPEKGEELFIIEIDPTRALNKKINVHNDVLADRRPELYADI